MHEIDRKDFMVAIERLCWVFERRLDKDGLNHIASSYWESLKRMPRETFDEVITLAIRREERFPKPSKLWGLSEELKRHALREEFKPGVGDGVYGYFQRLMFHWLWIRVKTNGVLSERRLQEVLEFKRRLEAEYRLLAGEKDPEATGERFVRLFADGADRIADREEAA